MLLLKCSGSAGVKRCYGIVGDTLNRVAELIEQSEIEWVSMRHEEAGAFAASAEAQLTGELVACAGSCGPGSLHFLSTDFMTLTAIVHRSFLLIASQIIRNDLGFELFKKWISKRYTATAQFTVI